MEGTTSINLFLGLYLEQLDVAHEVTNKQADRRTDIRTDDNRR